MTTAFRALDSFVVFGLLMLWAVVVSRVLERRRSEPPAELVAAISGWPPPVLDAKASWPHAPRRVPNQLCVRETPLGDTTAVFVWFGTWPAPDPSTRVA